MRKTIKLTTAALTALMAASTLSTTVFAADTPQAAQSTGDVTVEAGDASTDPTNPIIPGYPDDPDTPGTGNDGPLSIDAVTNLHFGTISVKNAGKAMPAKTENPIVLQTTDNRATGEGWTVYVQYGTKDATDDTKAAAPAVGDWVADGKTVGKGFKLAYPVIDYTKDVADSSTEVEHNQGTAPDGSAIAEVSDAAQPIATAAVGNGLGTWIGSFDPAKTTLTVPSTTLKGTYTADLVWTMAAAPQA